MAFVGLENQVLMDDGLVKRTNHYYACLVDGNIVINEYFNSFRYTIRATNCEIGLAVDDVAPNNFTWGIKMN